MTEHTTKTDFSSLRSIATEAKLNYKTALGAFQKSIQCICNVSYKIDEALFALVSCSQRLETLCNAPEEWASRLSVTKNFDEDRIVYMKHQDSFHKKSAEVCSILQHRIAKLPSAHDIGDVTAQLQDVLTNIENVFSGMASEEDNEIVDNFNMLLDVAKKMDVLVCKAEGTYEEVVKDTKLPKRGVNSSSTPAHVTDVDNMDVDDFQYSGMPSTRRQTRNDVAKQHDRSRVSDEWLDAIKVPDKPISTQKGKTSKAKSGGNVAAASTGGKKASQSNMNDFIVNDSEIEYESGEETARKKKKKTSPKYHDLASFNNVDDSTYLNKGYGSGGDEAVDVISTHRTNNHRHSSSSNNHYQPTMQSNPSALMKSMDKKAYSQDAEMDDDEPLQQQQHSSSSATKSSGKRGNSEVILLDDDDEVQQSSPFTPVVMKKSPPKSSPPDNVSDDAVENEGNDEEAAGLSMNSAIVNKPDIELSDDGSDGDDESHRKKMSAQMAEQGKNSGSYRNTPTSSAGNIKQDTDGSSRQNSAVKRPNEEVSVFSSFVNNCVDVLTSPFRSHVSDQAVAEHNTEDPPSKKHKVDHSTEQVDAETLAVIAEIDRATDEKEFQPEKQLTDSRGGNTRALTRSNANNSNVNNNTIKSTMRSNVAAKTEKSVIELD